MSAVRKAAVTVISIVFGALALGGLTLALIDWNIARDWIAEKVRNDTGRDLTIAGDLRVHPFSLNPRFRAGRVTLSNSDWGERKPMLAAEDIAFSISLPELIRGRLVFPDVSLRKPTVLLQRDRTGRRNWILAPDEQQTARSPQIVRLRVDAGQLEFRDEISHTALDARVNTTADGKYGVTFSVAGRAMGIPLSAAGMGGGLLTLLDERTPYPVRLKSTIGATSIDLEGTVNGIATLHAVDARFTISGRDLALLSDPLHIALPPTAPYRLTGRLSRRGSVWRFAAFRGTVGHSDLGGTFSVDTAGTRPFLRGALSSSLLDITDLGGFVGTDPGATPASVADRVLPQAGFDLDKMRRVDADVKLTARRFTDRERLPLDDLTAHLTLNDGVARLSPVVFGAAGGKMRSIVRLDARGSPINADIETAFEHLHLNRLVPRAEILESAIGTIDGNARLAGSGNSIATMLGTSDGRIAFASSGGNVSSLLLALAGANGARILQLLLLGDREAMLHCGAAAFSVRQGVMTSDVIDFDTSEVNIAGAGVVNLRDETLNLTANPLPKKPSVLSLRGPLHVTGTFRHPDLGLDKPTVSLRAGGALLLGIINPLAALVPLIETGPGKDIDCAQLTAAVLRPPGRTGKPSKMRLGREKSPIRPH